MNSAPAPAPAPRPTSSSSSSSSYTSASSFSTYESRREAEEWIRAENARIRGYLLEEKLRAFIEKTYDLPLPLDWMTPQEKLDLLERYRKSAAVLTTNDLEGLSYLADKYRVEQRRFEGEVRAEQDRLTKQILPALAQQSAGPAFERLTAFERLALLDRFVEGQATLSAPAGQAVHQLRAQLTSQIQETAQRKEVERKNLLSAARWRLSLTSFARPFLKKLFSPVTIDTTVSRVSQNILRKVSTIGQFVRKRWSSHVLFEQQTTIAVHSDPKNGKTVVHVDSTAMGTFFITLPTLLDPKLLKAASLFLRPILQLLCGSRQPIVIVDGDHQDLNYKHLLPDRDILRSRSSNTAPLLNRIEEIYSRPPLTPENTAVVGGIPASPAQLAAILEGDKETAERTWDLWRGLDAAWQKRVEGLGFTYAAAGDPKKAVLEALQTKQNVIIAFAHSDGERIFFPEPEPHGAILSGEDLEKARDGIAAAKPMVYLLCCHTGQTANVERFADRLLAMGVAGVVAPQTDIQAHRSLRLLRSLLKAGRKLGPLAALRKAERQSRYRELETWIG
jgi:hypothetical protein